MIRIPDSVDYHQLLLHVQNKFDLDERPVLKYEDEEGTLILITDDEDLSLGLITAGVLGPEGVRSTDEWELWCYDLQKS